jgi:hypothetical protein
LLLTTVLGGGFGDRAGLFARGGIGVGASAGSRVHVICAV